MFSEAKVTEIYCLADDFCKEFARNQENYMLKDTEKNYWCPIKVFKSDKI